MNQEFNLNKVLSFIRPKENSIFKIHDTNGIKLLNQLRLHFSHLNEYKFRNNFRATIHSICSWGLELETILHYLLCCNLYFNLKIELFNNICDLNPTSKNLWKAFGIFSCRRKIHPYMYGSEDFSFNKNKEMIKSTIKFLESSGRLIDSLFWLSI